jgi:phosphatidylinositol transfer protein SFH5
MSSTDPMEAPKAVDAVTEPEKPDTTTAAVMEPTAAPTGENTKPTPTTSLPPSKEKPTVATVEPDAKTEAEAEDQPPPTSIKDKILPIDPTPAATNDGTTTSTEAAKPQTPIDILHAALPSLLAEASHTEMWGVELNSDTLSHAPTQIVLQKFLNANNQDVEKAKEQLLAALKWRGKVNPLGLMKQEFDGAKFGGLGYVTVYDVDAKDGAGKGKKIISWNVYGGVKDIKATFGDVEEYASLLPLRSPSSPTILTLHRFIKWRTALMELSILPLDLPHATGPLDPGKPDPYQITQVHDYLSVSFLRMDPHIKAASKEVISVFSTAYPELLSTKYFVNVPAIMGWVFSAMKLFLSKETLRKFHPLAWGSSLAGDIGGAVGEKLPKAYGGKGAELVEVGDAVKLSKVEG